MSLEYVLDELKTRLSKEEQNYINQGLPNYVRLSRTRFFSVNKKQATTAHKIAAIKMAISIIEQPFRNIDVHEAVMMGVSDLNENKDTLLEKANSIFLREKAQAAKTVIETSLPIYKKEILEILSPYL